MLFVTKIFLILLYSTLTVIDALTDEEYCKKFGNDHTMCAYRANAFSTISSGLTETEKNEFVKVHNKLRNKVAKNQQKGQPCAKNMNELVWNDELAEIAQRWADQCDFSHDSNRKTDKFNYVGQNVYTARLSRDNKTIDPNVSVMAWYDEVTKPGFDPHNIKPFKASPGAMHYTQVVWAKTNSIGCGYTYYKDSTSQLVPYRRLLVCNYGPGGNIIGDVMYEKGRSCTGCKKCSSVYDGLCAPIAEN